ncbi:MAG: hypothetical protein AB7O29_15090, partial [Acidimicrobiia bacterium]
MSAQRVGVDWGSHTAMGGQGLVVAHGLVAGPAPEEEAAQHRHEGAAEPLAVLEAAPAAVERVDAEPVLASHDAGMEQAADPAQLAPGLQRGDLGLDAHAPAAGADAQVDGDP